MSVKDALNLFKSTYGDASIVVVAAPGRVNLIGEHTDYQDGFVMPLALEMRTVIVGALTTSGKCRIVSSQGDGNVVEFKGDRTLSQGSPSWANYVKGVVFQYLGDVPDGEVCFDAAIVSDVPLGGGLSSSASLEVAVGTLVEELYHLDISGPEKAMRARQCEHDFANMPCGIMDQFISACGQTGHCMLLDCRSRETTMVPLSDPDVSILIANSNTKHQLSGSEYPDRVRQCNEAVAVLQRKYPEVKALRDATMEQLEEVRSELQTVQYRRALHVISENDRTQHAAAALTRGDYEEVGRLMLASHASLSTNFEVSTHELDALVELVQPIEGVYGTRMTGGGFGGCTVTLTKTAALPEIRRVLALHYPGRSDGKWASVFTTQAGCGACVLTPGVDWEVGVEEGTTTATGGGGGRRGTATMVMCAAVVVGVAFGVSRILAARK